MASEIIIYRDGEQVARGRIENGEIACTAMLGPDDNASEEVYWGIERAIARGPEGAWKIHAPDGAYTWSVRAFR